MREKILFAFVLMPFDKALDHTYFCGIKSTVEKAGMRAERVDEQIFHREGILERIYNQIDAADLIIADMTGRNPNVFYEVGYAHAKHKLCILLTKDASDIPFDLKHQRHIVYASIQDLTSKLSNDLLVVKEEPQARSLYT
jgi:nucleoside 2-deoxyribosyltransferase